VTSYIGVSIESDPEVITDEALEALALSRPGFIAKEAHLEVQLLEVVSRMTAETRYLFNLVPDSIFRYFGESLVNVAPVAGAPAKALTTWTMIDTAGYTIPQGTRVAYRVAGDQLVVFFTSEEQIVLPGDSSIAAVFIEALEDGTSANTLGPSGLELVDSLSYVQSVTAAGPTSNGVERETDDAYLSRLRDEMRLLTPRFVLAKDAAVLARRISGVHRALGIDNYDPGDGSSDNEKMMTLSVVGADGLALSTPIKEEVEAYLESLRELNFVLHVVDPTYTTINVVFTVVVNDGYTLADVDDRATAAVAAYLSPATWAGGADSPPTWRTAEGVVRYLEVAEVLNRVDGVNYVQSLTVNTTSSDVNLTGIAPLPTVGTITGTTVNA
jgi:hypothetical protein